jgi:L-serine dehydratase
MISVLDIYKIGIGPSSSHTVGPMKIAKDFAGLLLDKKFTPVSVRVELHGSLALTGKGHGTDRAVVLGLAGSEPASVDVDSIPDFMSALRENKKLPLFGAGEIDFDYEKDIEFIPDNLPLHENGMRLFAKNADGAEISETYYSIGGGFFCDEKNFSPHGAPASDVPVPYPFATAEDLLDACNAEALSVSGLMMRNELAMRGRDELSARFESIWNVMRESMERGMRTEGLLPGGLRVPRRAIGLWRRLQTINSLSKDPMNIIDWVNMFAFAVSEENASGGRVVTAPTNGACGVAPAVLAYCDKFVNPVGPDDYGRFFLASGAIGILYKLNASISGAEVGCQGEVGVACSMSAAGLADIMGGSPECVCAAAEIAMEHCLGLTCDPVGGLVQVPCIERNAIMAVKAINSARMAMSRTTAPRVSLDKVIETMYETGKDMSSKYRETSQGGLAKLVNCG